MAEMDETNTVVLQNREPAIAFQVLDNLWIGSAPPIGWAVSEHFDCLVLSAVEYHPGPTCFPRVDTMAVPLNDDGSPMRKEEMSEAVRAAGKVIGWLRQGKRVLVSCYQGRNRSGLICALVLCKARGMTPKQAVAAVREARGPSALQNRYFLRFLKEYCSVREAKSP